MMLKMKKKKKKKKKTGAELYYIVTQFISAELVYLSGKNNNNH